MMSTDLWSEEYDCIPLGLRQKMLHSNRNRTDYCGISIDAEIGRLARNSNESMALFSEASELPTQQTSNNGSFDQFIVYHEDCEPDSKLNNSSISLSMVRASELGTDVEQLNNLVDTSLDQSTSNVPGNVMHDCSVGSTMSGANLQVSIKHEIVYDFDDSLDNVMLGERRKMLVARNLIQYSRLDMVEQDNGEKSKSSQVTLHNSKIDSIQDTPIGEHLNEVNECDNLALENTTDTTSQTSKKCSETIKSTSLPLSREGNSCDTNEPDTMNAPTIASSSSPLLAKVKNEPLDMNEICNEENSHMQNSLVDPTVTVKNEPWFSEHLVDELDHMPLANRLNLLSSGIPTLNASGNPKFIKEDVKSRSDFDNDILESVKPISISRPRKKRRTSTDSVETALEEDAPGLLKFLLERGVSAEEIKLYGEEDGEDGLDDSFSDDGFAELEAVISQLFSQRQTFLKFPLLRTKGAKVNYCLSCLLSLVEQTKYLRSRKWPVEWGWCRDLQSFIFVFQRHNRIVLERPEYGFATYFFELLNSVPVAWQIKRLVTAMKLTSCGRFTLIENKPLRVGEDLSEGEAQVLAQYGWRPNTGLGTMLNYCDRVVHDRKQELDSSDWRMKIGKQLMNGYNGGNLVANNLPKRLMESQEFQNIQVKLEEE